jgi:nitrogen fixation protein NifU and related proteins
MQLGVREGKVAEVAFTGRGCAISQASASLLTDEVRGMTVEQAAAFRADDLLELLGIDISPARLKCAMLSLETLEAALDELDQPAETTSDPATRPAATSGSPSNSEP